MRLCCRLHCRHEQADWLRTDKRGDYMALPKCTVPDNVIGSLANRPYEMGMTAQELKDKFDEMPEGIKKYLNEELVPALDEHLAETVSQLDQKANVVKKVAGGQYLEPIRVPTLITVKTFPNIRSPYTLLWAKDNEMYAYGNDLTLRKSIDGGSTWEVRGNNPRGFSNINAFLKLESGTLLTFSTPGGQQEIIRSVDDGETWDIVFNTRPGTMALGSQSWAIDKVTGFVYFGEYTISSELETIVLYRSTDDGQTWTPFHTFKGGLSADNDRIRHIHAVQWDHVDERIVICTGDGTDYTGLWRVNASNDGLEKILTNDMLSSAEMDIPRCIGIMPFDDYIAWAADTTAHPYVFRIKRSDIGKPNPSVERIPYRLNSTAWFTCKASDNGSIWVISGSNEGSSSLDNSVHLYAVEDQGSTIWEVGSLPSTTASLVSSLMPVGLPENHGNNFFMTARNFDRGYSWQFQMSKGLIGIPMPEEMPPFNVPQTISVPEITLGPGEEKVVGTTMAGVYARRLYILEASIRTVDTGGVSSGFQRLIVGNSSRGELFNYKELSERCIRRRDFSPYLERTEPLSNGEVVYISIKNTHPSVTISVMGSITFAWGR